VYGTPELLSSSTISPFVSKWATTRPGDTWPSQRSPLELWVTQGRQFTIPACHALVDGPQCFAPPNKGCHQVTDSRETQRHECSCPHTSLSAAGTSGNWRTSSRALYTSSLTPACRCHQLSQQNQMRQHNR
jgi:hypothetical protein